MAIMLLSRSFLATVFAFFPKHRCADVCKNHRQESWKLGSPCTFADLSDTFSSELPAFSSAVSRSEPLKKDSLPHLSESLRQRKTNREIPNFEWNLSFLHRFRKPETRILHVTSVHDGGLYGPDILAINASILVQSSSSARGYAVSRCSSEKLATMITNQAWFPRCAHTSFPKYHRRDIDSVPSAGAAAWWPA